MRLAELAEKVGASVDGDPTIEIVGLAPIEEAGPGLLTFVANPRYAKYLATTKASAVIVGSDVEVGSLTALRAPEPYAIFVAALALFDARPQPKPGVHATAVVADSATVGEGAYIGPHAVIGDDAVIGRDARIHPHVVIYAQVSIGDRFTAHAGAVVRECSRLGDDVTLQPGCVIGGDGFGFLPGGEVPLTIAQIGGVEIGDGVDIGSNTTVDRAAIGNTRLAKGVKLDNLVQIAHGCRIGEASMFAAQVGLAGSTIIGRRVLAGGQSGCAGHLEVGDDAQIGARAAVLADVSGGRTVAGHPAVDVGLWRRVAVALSRLPELLKRVRALETRLGERDGDEKSQDRE